MTGIPSSTSFKSSEVALIPVMTQGHTQGRALDEVRHEDTKFKEVLTPRIVQILSLNSNFIP